MALPSGEARAAAVCYKLPFNNPNLADGWGSTCCGRTSPHRGVDFPQPAGKSVPAAAAGKVAVNTWNGCLGNVVVLQHADGMYSGYSHLGAKSSLKKGASVKIGQTIGKVGKTGSCAKGAHLHLSMSKTAGGYASGTTVDPYAYIKKHLTCNAAPKGKLEKVGCQTISGWAQDPDDAKTGISTRLYFGGSASDKDALHGTITADVPRKDLCDSLKSCDHGFEMRSPLSMFDGAPHKVYAYAIDTDSDKKTELSSSPRTMTCALVLDGLRRPIADPDVLAAWHFSALLDTLTLDDAALGALGETLALPPTPLLARADDESAQVWLLDGPAQDMRRAVPEAAAAAWHLDLETAEVWPAADLAALTEAPPLRPRPVVVKGSGPALYLLDVSLTPEEAGDDSSGGGESTSGEVETGADEDTTGAVGSSSGETGDGGGTTAADPVTSGGGISGTSSSGEAPTDGEEPHGAALPGEYGAEDGCDCRGGDTRGAWLGALVLLMLAPRRRRVGRSA